MLRIIDPPTLATVRGAGFDTLQRFFPRIEKNPKPVRIIDIDEASLKTFGQWPWPRTLMAKLIDELNQLGAASIAFDIIFSEPDRMSPALILNDPEVRSKLPADFPRDSLPNNDNIFATAIVGKRVVLAFAGGKDASEPAPQPKAGFALTGLAALDAVPQLRKATNNLDILNQAAAGLGNINIDLRSEQGVLRRIPLLVSDGKTFSPSLALEALRIAQGVETFVVNASPTTENVIESIRVGDVEIPVADDGQFPIYYTRNKPELYISAARLISGNEREALRPLVEGHIVLVGTSAISLQDTKTSSLGESIPGVSVHAQVLQQILSGQFLHRSELNSYA
ncbi:MAG: CHASE2 domain-containing protein, partial [Alphaproteobacteria bacterium]|nr:CHASE2 domain-containing protein [Alphaproteobacteria bacterium]